MSLIRKKKNLTHFLNTEMQFKGPKTEALSELKIIRAEYGSFLQEGLIHITHRVKDEILDFKNFQKSKSPKMIKKQLGLMMSFFVILLACNSQNKVISNKIKEYSKVDYFADNGFGNAVALVQHPAGIYHKGVTYVCYQGPLEDPYVAAYNHETGEWEGPYQVGISEMGKDPNRKKLIDNHGKPSIIIDDTDYIHITFGGHGGMREHGENPLGNHHYGRNLHAISKRPLDISSWKILDNIPPFGTYNQFVKMDNGDIYLFYRHGAHRSDWIYQKSTDNGLNFDAPVSFLKHKRRTDIEAEDSWYPWISKGKEDDLIVAFDYHLCRDNKNRQDKRGHIAERHNLYYMVFDTKTGAWKNVRNESLEMPLTKEMADEKTLIKEISDDWTFQAITDVDPNGNPHVCIMVGPDVGARRSGPKRIQHFRWNGQKWLQGNTANIPKGGGDLEVNSEKEISLYIESKTSDNVGQISRWDSYDGGGSFKKEKTIIQREDSGFVISALIDNPHPDARIIAAEKVEGTYFRKMYLLGDGGIIRREIK